jgi:hypothetical protein
MKTIWLAVVVVALGTAGQADAQDSMLQKLLGRPSKAKKELWATEYTPTKAKNTPRAQPAAKIDPPVGSILPQVPIIVPAAPTAKSAPSSVKIAPSEGPSLPLAAIVASPAPVSTSTSSGVRAVSAIFEPASPVLYSAILPAAPPDASSPITPAAPPVMPPVMHEPVPARGAKVACAAKEKCDHVQTVLGRLRKWIVFRQLHGCCCDWANCCHIPPLYLYTAHDCVEGPHSHELPCCAHEKGPFRGVLLCDKETLNASKKHPVEHP